MDSDGDLVTLEHQDRTRWDAGLIAEGVALLGSPTGPYAIQATITACHATAATPQDTDWRRIAELYAALARCLPSPVVELNRAVAIGMADGPAAGLHHLDRLAGTNALRGYHLLPATRADLLRRLGATGAALAAYREALALAGTDAERRYLARRVAQLTSRAGPDPAGSFVGGT